MSSSRKPVNYLSNKNILKALHESKKSYCSYLESWHSDYDAVVLSPDNLTSSLFHDLAQSSDKPLDTIVIRVMTNEHVVLGPATKYRKKDSVPVMPGFKHYILQDDAFVEICRSHWKGGFSNGHYCDDHGKLSRELVNIIMLLTRRYATRGNWRGYSWIEDMQAEALAHLCTVCLKFNEAKSDNPFAYFSQICLNIFRKVLKREKAVGELKDDLYEIAGMGTSHRRQDSDHQRS